MNQMTSNIVAFRTARPLNGTSAGAAGQAGLFTAIGGHIRRYLAARRTLRALDRLDDHMLKDIGFRRIPGEYSRYERLS